MQALCSSWSACARLASQLLLPHLLCLNVAFPLGLALSFCAGRRLVLL